MDYGIFDCIDAGTENCPCYLALTGDCLTCSRLAGGDCCDCRWAGVCIYNEFMQNGGRINNARKNFQARIVSKKYYLPDLAVLVLDVGRGFALKASKPGSYIFLKTAASEAFYNVPISIMKSDVEKGHIHIAVKSISAKTKLITAEEETLLIRGVYRNGMLGLEGITGPRGRIEKDKRTLTVSKGVGFAPAVLLGEWMDGKAALDILADRDKITKELVDDYSPHVKGIIAGINLAETDEAFWENFIELGDYDNVVALTSDYYIGLLRAAVERVNGARDDDRPKVCFAHANNFKICCGEGICGGCTFTDESGCSFKMCKCKDLP